MKIKSKSSRSVAGAVALAVALFSSAPTAWAHVYATDIKINGNLFGVHPSSLTPASPVTITYHLNQLADLGCTIYISNSTPALVATIAGGTAMGLNSVTWGGTNNAGSPVATAGSTFTVGITASATGYPFWTQISVDGPNTVAVFAHGVAVNPNPASPYYGRVFVNCGINASAHGVSQMVGIYKYNADATPADEGSFGYGNYTTNNSGQLAINNAGYTVPEMVIHGSSGNGERTMRVGPDDRLYMNDFSDDGSVVAFDMLVSTNQMVIDQDDADQQLNYPNTGTYINSDEAGLLNNGIDCFDVIPNGPNASVFLGDDDYSGWGVWMFHMVNGVADPADTDGNQAVGQSGDLLLASGGVAVDNNLDIFASALRSNAGDANARTVLFLNWNGGTIPPENGGYTYGTGITTGQAQWAVGANDDTMTGIFDTVIDSRANPKYVAVTMHAGAPVPGGYVSGTNAPSNGGIRLLNAVDGSVVSVTNGATVQTLTNLDLANWYEGASFDAMGNLYASSQSANYWRVWSPPGANTSTTVAVAQISITTLFSITSITSTPTTPGCANVTINFTCPGGLASTAFTVAGSTSVSGPYSPVSATITGSAGTYQATFSSCSTRFYQIEHN